MTCEVLISWSPNLPLHQCVVPKVYKLVLCEITNVSYPLKQDILHLKPKSYTYYFLTISNCFEMLILSVIYLTSNSYRLDQLGHAKE